MCKHLYRLFLNVECFLKLLKKRITGLVKPPLNINDLKECFEPLSTVYNKHKLDRNHTGLLSFVWLSKKHKETFYSLAFFCQFIICADIFWSQIACSYDCYLCFESLEKVSDVTMTLSTLHFRPSTPCGLVCQIVSTVGLMTCDGSTLEFDTLFSLMYTLCDNQACEAPTELIATLTDGDEKRLGYYHRQNTIYKFNDLSWTLWHVEVVADYDFMLRKKRSKNTILLTVSLHENMLYYSVLNESLFRDIFRF